MNEILFIYLSSVINYIGNIFIIIGGLLFGFFSLNDDRKSIAILIVSLILLLIGLLIPDKVTLEKMYKCYNDQKVTIGEMK